MDAIQMLLERICVDIEAELKPPLRGIAGPIIGNYLPQSWVFETEMGNCTLFVDTEGNARVFPDSGADRDVTIHWKYDSLRTLLESRSAESVQTLGSPTIVAHTHKGQTAFTFLRKRFGL